MSDSCPKNVFKARAAIAGFFICALSFAHAGTPDFSKLNFLQLCAKVRHGNSAALEELVARNAYPAAEIAFIVRGEIFVGMTEGSAVCALGAAESINTTHTSAGEHIQAVYPEGRKIRYVYVDNGEVTAWQE